MLHPTPGASTPRRPRCACGRFTKTEPTPPETTPEPEPTPPRGETRKGKTPRRLELAESEAFLTLAVNDKIAKHASSCSIRSIWNSDLALIISYTLDALSTLEEVRP